MLNIPYLYNEDIPHPDEKELMARCATRLSGAPLPILPVKLGGSSFNSATHTIEAYLKTAPCWQGAHRLVLFDASLKENWANPAGGGQSGDLSHLVLLFPEVFWVELDDSQPLFANWLRSSILPSALYDGLGIRDTVRHALIKSVPDLATLRRRTALGISLDEERPFAEVHAYALYRRGYRAFPLTTHAEAEFALGNRANEVAVTIEDRDLRFADIREAAEDPLANDLRNLVAGRIKRYPKLGKATRWLCSLDGTVGLSPEERAAFDTRIVSKPSPGILELLNILPPAEANASHPVGETRRHAAPGVASWIAEALLQRAHTLFHGSPTTVDCLRGAVLALDAQELLCGKSATTGFEALRLRHLFETRFEIAFAGASYRTRADRRIETIEAEIKSLMARPAFDEKSESHPHPLEPARDWDERRIRSEWLVRIFSDLERVYRAGGDFEDSELFASRARLHDIELRIARKLSPRSSERPKAPRRLTVIGVQLGMLHKRIIWAILRHPWRSLTLLTATFGYTLFFAWWSNCLDSYLPVMRSFFAGEVELYKDFGPSAIAGAFIATLGFLFSGVLSGIVTYRLLRR